MIDIRWTWLFLDTPRVDAARSWAFWAEVTGWSLSPTRGDHDEFATLQPPRGDAWLKVGSLIEQVPDTGSELRFVHSLLGRLIA